MATDPEEMQLEIEKLQAQVSGLQSCLHAVATALCVISPEALPQLRQRLRSAQNGGYQMAVEDGLLFDLEQQISDLPGGND